MLLPHHRAPGTHRRSALRRAWDWYGLLRRCRIEHVSTEPPVTWPPGVPRPGEPGWPQLALQWIEDQLPHHQWRHRLLGNRPWVLTVAAIMAVRSDIESLRRQYRNTATYLAGQLPPNTTREVLTATTDEAQRLNVLLGQLIALEEPLGYEVLNQRRRTTEPDGVRPAT